MCPLHLLHFAGWRGDVDAATSFTAAALIGTALVLEVHAIASPAVRVSKKSVLRMNVSHRPLQRTAPPFGFHLRTGTTTGSAAARAGLIAQLHKQAIAGAADTSAWQRTLKARIDKDARSITGSGLDKAREIFAEAIYNRPRIRQAIRQRTQVLVQWPKP